MIRVLSIQASPRGALSASRRVALAYIDALREKAALHIDDLDLWSADLPPFDGHALAGKYTALAGQPMSAEQQEAWRAIEMLGKRFRDADVIVMSVPMWNFGIPYRLKHLIDLVTQKDVTFRFDANGFDGMLKTQRAVVVCARGLGYDDGSGLTEEKFDFQRAYLMEWLGFVGVTDIKTIRVEKTLLGEDVCAASLDQSIREARQLAALAKAA